MLSRILKKYSVAEFSSSLSLLLSSGVNVVEALEISVSSTKDARIKKDLGRALELVKEGHPLSRALLNSSIADPFLLNMIKAGERSGFLSETLDSALEYYEEDVDSEVASLARLVEPLLLLFMGVVVGLMILSIFLPIVKMAMAV